MLTEDLIKLLETDIREIIENKTWTIQKLADELIKKEWIKLNHIKEMTNREWLESLSDKELAYVIIDVDVKSCQEMYKNNLCQYPQKNACEKCKTKWLKMEHKE